LFVGTKKNAENGLKKPACFLLFFCTAKKSTFDIWAGFEPVYDCSLLWQTLSYVKEL